MNKKYFGLSLALAMGLAPMVATPIFAEEGTKDVYIDNTVDESVSYVTGTVTVIDPETGTETTEMVYDQSFSVTYSNPLPAEVQNSINDAQTAVSNKALEYGDTFTADYQVETGKVWDNRKYTTVEDGDAVLIGDTDYLDGAYGASDYTRTHIASGGYGKETFYRLTGTVTLTKSQTEEPVIVEEPAVVEQPVEQAVQPVVQSAPAVQPQVQYSKGVNTGIFNGIHLWMTTAMTSLAGAIAVLRKRK